MSAPDIDRSLMDQFIALTGNAHLTILLGAGASVPSGLPSWEGFAKKLAVLSGLVSNETAADALLAKQDPTIVLQAASLRAGNEWPGHLYAALFPDGESAPSPSPLHLATAAHYLNAKSQTTLSTLNFDTLLERALENAREGDEQIVIGINGEETQGATTVHHLHGAIFNRSAYSPVIGFSDYAELVADQVAWQFKFLDNALQLGPLLLAGTSYRDPDIRHWLHLILREKGVDNPALVTIVREGLRLDHDTFDTISDALVSEWESIGLTALVMQDLADVAQIIRELRHVGTRSYRSPNERARAVWTAHANHFDALQREYADVLEKDRARVSRALAAPSHRGTLWLADGRRTLARWSTEHTLYQSTRHLKHVPTGHDSPRIAGEAIGSEEVKLINVDRTPRISPTWQSVLALPIFVGDDQTPDFASGVLTFGLDRRAETLLNRREEWLPLVEELTSEWGTRLSDVAFSA